MMGGAFDLQGVAKRGVKTYRVRKAVSRVESLSSMAHGRLSQHPRALVSRCDRGLRRLAGRAREALIGGPGNGDALPGKALSAGHQSPLTTVALGASLQRQLLAEIEGYQRAGRDTQDAYLRAQLTERAAELRTHLEMLMASTGQTVSPHAILS